MSPETHHEHKKVSKHMSLVVFGYYATPKMAEMLVKGGLVKNEDKAMTILRLIATFFFLATFLVLILYVFRYNPFSPPTPTNEEIMKSMGIPR